MIGGNLTLLLFFVVQGQYIIGGNLTLLIFFVVLRTIGPVEGGGYPVHLCVLSVPQSCP